MEDEQYQGSYLSFHRCRSRHVTDVLQSLRQGKKYDNDYIRNRKFGEAQGSKADT